MSKANTSNRNETHPDWYYEPAKIHTLILGSFPPHPKRWNYAFYYPNAQNRFWKILAEITNFSLPKFNKNTPNEIYVAERKKIMHILNLGIQNMGKTILRKNESSFDTDIEITSYHDILSIIKNHSELKQILIPGFAAKSSTFYSFINYLNIHQIKYEGIEKPCSHKKFHVYIEKRKIPCIILNSTSGAARIPYADIKNQFAKYLGI